MFSSKFEPSHLYGHHIHLYRENVVGTALILSLECLEDDEGAKDRVLPGTHKVGKIESKYALLTTYNVFQEHITNPKSDCIDSTISWSFCHPTTGERERGKELKTHVCGVTSCCGNHSFIGPGGTSLQVHTDGECDANLDFILLFLRKSFESCLRNETPHQKEGMNAVRVSLPLDPQEFAQLQGMFMLVAQETAAKVSLPATPLLVGGGGVTNGGASKSLPGGAVISDEIGSCPSPPQSEKEAMKKQPQPAMTFGVLVCDNGIGGNQECLAPILICSPVMSQTVGSPLAREGPRPLSLKEEIAIFKKFQRIEYSFPCGSAPASLLPGAPILCRCGQDEGECFVIGIHLKVSPDKPAGSGLLLHCLFQLLEGGPVPCLTLLSNPQINRLWQDRWGCLLLPYLQRKERLELKLALELLQALMEKPYGTSLLSVGVRDPAATRTATLRIIAALFHHFKFYTSAEIVEAVDGLRDATFIANIRELFGSLVKCVSNVKTYPSLEDSVLELAQVCMECCSKVLHFRYRGVAKEMVTNSLDSLEELCSRLSECCTTESSSNTFQTHMTHMTELFRLLYHYNKDEHSAMQVRHQEEHRHQMELLEEEEKKHAECKTLVINQQQINEDLKNEISKSKEDLKKVLDKKKTVKQELKHTQEQLRQCQLAESSALSAKVELERQLGEKSGQLKEAETRAREAELKVKQTEVEKKEVEVKMKEAAEEAEKERQALNDTISQLEIEMKKLQEEAKSKEGPEKPTYAKAVSRSYSQSKGTPPPSHIGFSRSQSVSAAAKRRPNSSKNSSQSSSSPATPSPTVRPRKTENSKSSSQKKPHF